MSARRKLRQLIAGRIAKFKQVDAVGDLVIARDAQRHRRRWRTGRHYVSNEGGVTYNKWRLWRSEASASLPRRPSGAGNILRTASRAVRVSRSCDEADDFVFLQLLHDAGELRLRDSSHRNADFVQATCRRSAGDRQLVAFQKPR